MTLALSPPPCPDSFVRRLDPRWKLAGLLAAAAAASASRTLPVTALALLGALALAALARLPPRWYFGRVGAVALFLALLTLPLPLFPGGRGVETALLVWGKALTVLTLMLVLVASAPLEETLKAAHALRVPGLFVQLAVLTYRYIFVLTGELDRLRVALRARAFRARADRHTYRTVGHVAGSLLVRGFERAERVGQAMRCRGFAGRFHSLAEFRTRPADVAAFVVVVGTAAALLAWDVWLRS